MSARRLDAQLQEAALARYGASRQALEAQIQRTLQSDRSVAEKTFHAVMKELDAILPLAAKPILEAAAVRKQCTPKQIQEMAKKVTAAPPIIADGAAADVRAFAADKRASVDVATRLWRETAETAVRPLEESDAGVEAALRDVREAASRRRAEQGRLADAGAAVAERAARRFAPRGARARRPARARRRSSGATSRRWRARAARCAPISNRCARRRPRARRRSIATPRARRTRRRRRRRWRTRRSVRRRTRRRAGRRRPCRRWSCCCSSCARRRTPPRRTAKPRA